MTRMRSLAALAATAALLLSACDISVSKMPLPGGADVGDDPIVVHALFPDVLDLVPQSTVKLNDVTIGKVTDVTLKDYQADVEMKLRKDVDLPDNVEAEIRQTSLLGEKFVSLRMPENPSEGRLGDKDVIGLDRTNRNPEVEEVLGALSLLLNGGGVAQLKTIAHELNLALEGREGNARSVLTQIESFMGQLDANKGDIVRAIDSLNNLSVAANKQRGTIESALDELPSALKSLDKQRADLVKMLGALNRLSAVGTEVIAASKDSTIAALQALNPVLGQLGATGDDFVKAFHVFLTYPFVDEVVGRNPQVAKNLHMGDYTNLEVKLDINIGGAPGGPGGPVGTGLPTFLDPSVILNNVLACLGGNAQKCAEILKTGQGLTQLRAKCKEPANQNALICKTLNGLPIGSLGTSSGGAQLPSLPGLPLGLGRAPTAVDRPFSLDRLMALYDPVLVQLLLPGVAE